MVKSRRGMRKRWHGRRRWRRTYKRYGKGRRSKRGGAVVYPARGRFIKMSFVENATVANTAPGVPGTPTLGHGYYLNGIYNPSTGLGESLPLGYRLGLNGYNNYMVVGAKVNMKVILEGATSPGAYFVHRISDNPAGGLTTAMAMTDATVDPATKVSCLNGPGTTGAGSWIGFSRGWSAKKHFGFKDYKDVHDDYGSAFGANPTHVAYFSFGVWPSNATSAAAPTFTYRIRVQYLVWCSKRKPEYMGGSI